MTPYQPVVAPGETWRSGGHDDQGAQALLSSPFAAARVAAAPFGGVTEAGQESLGHTATTDNQLWLASPFDAGLATYDEAELAVEAFRGLVAELADEEFDSALEALAEEAAARHVGGAASWTGQSEAPSLAEIEVEAWMSAVAAKADQMLAHLEEHFGDRTPGSIAEGEIEIAAGRTVPAAGEHGDEDEDTLADATEEFLGKLVRKAGRLVSSAAKVVGTLHPVAALFRMLRRLVRPLLSRVLKSAIGKLPPSVRPIAQRLAARLTGAGAGSGAASAAGDMGSGAAASDAAFTGRAAANTAEGDPAVLARAGAAPASAAGTAAATGASETEVLSEQFDLLLAEAVLAPGEAAVDRLLGEAEDADARADAARAWVGAGSESGTIAALDAARARLTRELTEVAPGEAPFTQLQQFIPAALPVLRIGLRLAGRDRVVNFLAARLGTLIQNHVGVDAARSLARHIASAGLGMLGLEAESGQFGAFTPGGVGLAADPATGMEALVAALEDTIREVAALPPASLANQLRLDAEVQRVFGESVARHLPRQALRNDLEGFETAGEGGVWIVMPRASRPVFRYKKYSRVYPVLITRPLARAILLADGATLERQLLDCGVRQWPVAAEAHLYEALPGTRLGHLAAFEALGGDIPAAAAELAEEFEELTPAVAALLTAEPGLGRPSSEHAGPAAAYPGRRYYRITSPGGQRLARQRRRRKRIALRLDGNRVLRVHVRLSERESGAVAGMLAQKSHVRVVSLFRELLGPPARSYVAAWLGRPGSRRPAGLPLPAQRAHALATHLAEAVVTGVAGQLPAAAAQLAQATRDPARGVTLTFAFPFADAGALANGTPGAPALTIRPGRYRD
ncbi:MULTISPECIES: hypothetical protein [unclassified Pseudofrankia]|uniref:hypothetical protein n=1 Tax=unclassified Pseudofrankia TaxID=2994372 RepID=UPI0008D993EC|nr:MULTISPECIES: hypothetical protein [unclassified Pseudofrankia]MDT3439330.1 hypothetical protein [Pseudofrankia sp. BMG5.37]OHV73950.1 hypothetical protein BCD48_32940 [Pseudofrankia sp. BMG5.36]